MKEYNQYPSLGLIGGAGVAATNLLQKLIEESFTNKMGAFRDAHHPQIFVHQATQAPSRSMYYEGRGASFIKDYSDAAVNFQKQGATLIAMCCNTAHAAHSEISSKVSVPFVNIIDESLRSIAVNSSLRKVGLIASAGCIKSGIYQRSFAENFENIELFIPNESIQAEITRGIVNIKNKNRFLNDEAIDRPKNIFKNIIKILKKQECDAVLLACTDIAVDFDIHENYGLVVYDSTRILADAIVRELLSQYPGNSNAVLFYDSLSSTIRNPSETKNKALDGSAIDAKFITSQLSSSSSLLDLGSGTGLVLNKIVDKFSSITAVEKYLEFSSFINVASNLTIINSDLLDFYPSQEYDAVTIFACLNYFNFYEAIKIYDIAWRALKPGGKLIVKHQMGKAETVVVSKIIEDLGGYYFSQYRSLNDEVCMISNVGFLNVEVFDIYPSEFNRFDNTHFYALVASKVY